MRSQEKPQESLFVCRLRIHPLDGLHWGWNFATGIHLVPEEFRGRVIQGWRTEPVIAGVEITSISYGGQDLAKYPTKHRESLTLRIPAAIATCVHNWTKEVQEVSVYLDLE